MVRSMAEAYRGHYGDEAHAIELEALAKTLDRLYADRDEFERLRVAAKRVHEQSVRGGGYGQTLAFEDALRDLEAALFGDRAPRAKEK
jgi:hypothetical protein